MRDLLRLLPFCCLLAFLGCGPVPANYPPEARDPAAKPLPEEYRRGKYEGRLVWREPGRVHGFLILWEDTADMILRLSRWNTGQNRQAAADLRRFRRYDQRGFCYATLVIFVAEDLERLVGDGDLRVEFTDGTSVRSQELLLYPAEGTTDPIQATTASDLLIRGEDDRYQQGRTFYIFVPRSEVQKTVASVSYLPG